MKNITSDLLNGLRYINTESYQELFKPINVDRSCVGLVDNKVWNHLGSKLMTELHRNLYQEIETQLANIVR